jgi:NAD+ diphosphatase
MSRFFDGLPAEEPSMRTGFAGNRIARWSEHRKADAVPVALADAQARLYLFRADKALLRGNDPLFAATEAGALGVPFADAVLLGWTSAGPRIAAALPDSAPVDEALVTLADLRSLAMAGELDAEHLGALAQARSLLAWHGRHGFCGNCGQPTEIAIGGYRRDCPACNTQHFPRTDPVVIMLAIHDGIDGERALLGRQPHFAPGMYSCLAGFLEPGETIEAAVRRETHEESGVRIGRVRYHASQPWPFQSSLMIGCHAEALTADIEMDGEELEACRWFSRDEVRHMLAGAHPDGLKAPFPLAIANLLIRAWAEAG